jgi:tryptophan synthase beta chain
VLRTAGARDKDDVIVICLSGRGDKDVYEVARVLGREI